MTESVEEAEKRIKEILKRDKDFLEKAKKDFEEITGETMEEFDRKYKENPHYGKVALGRFSEMIAKIERLERIMPHTGATCKWNQEYASCRIGDANIICGLPDRCVNDRWEFRD